MKGKNKPNKSKPTTVIKRAKPLKRKKGPNGTDNYPPKYVKKRGEKKLETVN